LLTLRDPVLYTGRAILFLCACTFFATVYISSRDRVQDQALNRAWLVMWIISVPTNMGVAVAFALNQEFAVVRREVRAGMYQLVPYILAQTMLQVPLMFVLSFCSISLGGYALGNWDSAQLLMMVTLHALVMLAYECIAQAFSALFSNPLLGMLLFMSVWFVSFLFSGFLISPSDVFLPLRWLCHVFPLGYGISSMIFTEFHASTFEGAMVDPAAVRGYSCLNDPTYKKCFGSTGIQVLDSFHSLFETVSSEDTVMFDAGVCLAISVAWKLVFTAIAFAKCRGGIQVTAAAVSRRVEPADGPKLLGQEDRQCTRHVAK